MFTVNMSTCNAKAASHGAEALYLKATFATGAGAMKPRVERSGTRGHAFWNPEQAGAEDQCAKRARI